MSCLIYDSIFLCQLLHSFMYYKLLNDAGTSPRIHFAHIIHFETPWGYTKIPYSNFYKHIYHTLNTIERHHRYAEKRETGDMRKCTHDWHLAHKFSS